MLLENGAELTVLDNEKNSALHHSCANVSTSSTCVVFEDGHQENRKSWVMSYTFLHSMG